MKKRFINIFIILIMIITISSSCYAFNPTFKPQRSDVNNKDFLAYYTLNAATITLDNGQVIARANVTGGSKVEVDRKDNDVDIILILDNSASMQQGKKLQALHEAVNGFINNISTTFTKYRIALLTFTGVKQNFTDDIELIRKRIGKLQGQERGSDLRGAIEALEKALKTGNDLTFLPNPVKTAVITLTDGKVKNCSESYKSFIEEKDWLVYNIALETNDISAFYDKTSEEYIGKVYQDINSDELKGIYNEIFSDIVEVANSSIDEKFTFYCENAIILDNIVQFTLDYELAQSALLTVEYLFDIKPNFNCTSITITDEIGDFSYNSNSKLLTKVENEKDTNAEQGWNPTNKSSEYIFQQMSAEGEEFVIDKYQDFQRKIVLTKRININDVNDKGNWMNSAKFSIKGINYKGEAVEYTTPEGEEFSYKICVIPPLGSKDNYNVTKLLCTLVFVLIVTFAIIINIKFEINRINKK